MQITSTLLGSKCTKYWDFLLFLSQVLTEMTHLLVMRIINLFLYIYMNMMLFV